MFGLNNAQLIGRLGADATISHLTNGGRVANISIATDESFLDKNSGDKVDRTEWHRIVTFQDGLVEMMEKHAKKGRLVYVSGKLQTRKWRKDGEDSDRFSTEILLVPGGRVQFLDKPNGNGAPAMNGDYRVGRRDRRDGGRQRNSVLSGLPPSRITQGQSPPSWRGAGPSFLPARSSLPPQSSQTVYTRGGRAARSATRGHSPSRVRGGPEGGVPKQAGEVPHATVSRHRTPKESRPMNATEIASALSTRAEDVCRRYLPRGRRQGRYWTVWRHKRRRGALALCAPGAPRHTRKMDRRRDQRAWRSARSHPSAHRRSIAAARHGGSPRVPSHCRRATPANGGDHAGGYDREEAARRLWRRCRPIDGTHAEAYLHARAIGHCRFPALRFHPDLIHRGDDGIHRLPALVAAVTGDDGAHRGRTAHLARPQAARQGQSRSPAQSAWARPRQGRALRRVRLRRDPACRRRHRDRAVSGHRSPSVFMPRRLYRRAAWAHSNRPKTSPCWSSPAIKMCKAGTQRIAFSTAVWNAAFPQS